ncbi:MAG: apolipoprotein N-acyltransferase [Methylococcales bacterium]
MPKQNSIYRDCIAALSGVLLALAFAPYDYRYFSILSLALLFFCWQGITPGRATTRGFLFGLGLFGFGIAWVYVSIHDFGQADVIPASILTLLFISLWALFPALAGYITVRFFNTHSRSFQLLTWPIVWILIEYLRGNWIFNGFPWFQLAYSQLDSPFSGYIPILGVYGSGWLIAITAILLLHLTQKKYNNPLFPLGSVFVILVAGWSLSQIAWTHVTGKPFKVTLLQGNIAQDKKWKLEHRQEILQWYKKMSALHWDSKLIIWPESAVPAFYHRVLDDYLLPLENEAKNHGTDLVISIPYKNEKGEKYNTVMTFGETHGMYKKIHLLPFGEYLPFRPLFNLILGSLNIMPVGHFTAGKVDQPLLKAAQHPFLATICYEDAFGEEGRRGLPEAAYLVNVTNDGWFGETIEPYQHMQIARMRALETGRYLLRSTNNGFTGIVAPNGKIIHQAPLFTATSLTGEITPMAGTTIFVRFGERPVILVLVILLIVSVKTKSRFS